GGDIGTPRLERAGAHVADRLGAVGVDRVDGGGVERGVVAGDRGIDVEIDVEYRWANRGSSGERDAGDIHVDAARRGIRRDALQLVLPAAGEGRMPTRGPAARTRRGRRRLGDTAGCDAPRDD